NRINWIGDRDSVPIAENIEDITAIGFRALRHKNFVGRDLDPAPAIIVLRDFFAERFETLLVTVAAKGFADAQLIDGVMHRRDHGKWQRLGNVADPATDQTLRRFAIRVTKFANAPRDLGEKI